MADEHILDVDVRVTAGTFRLDAAFRIGPGVTVLFGPSGSGKSTTLAAISGLIRPEGGRVALGNEVWFDSKTGVEEPVHRRGISLVFQTLALFPHLTALGNVEYGIDRGVPRPERRRRALEMLERMKVAHVVDRRPSTFSGGEGQRVALARAFARAPKLVLLDEAFSAMDRELRYELGADVRSLVTELGIPALVVTHHRMEARTIGDNAVLIDEGRVGAAGPVRETVPAPDRD
jgi:molybdate transport system ATP-binding protein